MKIGYARVSTQRQDLEKQIQDLEAEGCQRIYQEKVSGTKFNRAELNKLLSPDSLELREGDTIVVTDLARLSRSLKDLFKVVEMIQKRGINLKSLKEGLIDTTTPSGNLVFSMFGLLSQFERDMISLRTKESLAVLRNKGIKLGRPTAENIDVAITMYHSNKYTVPQIVERTGVSKATLYRYLKKEATNQ